MYRDASLSNRIVAVIVLAEPGMNGTTRLIVTVIFIIFISYNYGGT